MALSKDFVQAVRSRIEENPAFSTARLAVELGAREMDVITALPLDMRKRGKLDEVEAIWRELQHCGKIESIVPEQAKYTLPADFMAAIPSLQDVGCIWFMQIPPDKVNGACAAEEYAVRFFDKAGEPMLSISLGRDGAKETYAGLCERYGITPVPHIHCKGCGKCTCGKARQH